MKRKGGNKWNGIEMKYSNRAGKRGGNGKERRN